MPPMRIMAPTPPTTPPIIFFDAPERLELEPLESSFRLGERVEVAKPVVEESTRLEVTATEVACPLMVVGMVETPVEVELPTRAEVTVVDFVTRLEDDRVEEAPELDDDAVCDEDEEEELGVEESLVGALVSEVVGGVVVGVSDGDGLFDGEDESDGLRLGDIDSESVGKVGDTVGNRGVVEGPVVKIPVSCLFAIFFTSSSTSSATAVTARTNSKSTRCALHAGRRIVFSM
jgi:hypothetical protein